LINQGKYLESAGDESKSAGRNPRAFNARRLKGALQIYTITFVKVNGRFRTNAVISQSDHRRNAGKTRTTNPATDSLQLRN
jgi:hypothetical protein